MQPYFFILYAAGVDIRVGVGNGMRFNQSKRVIMYDCKNWPPRILINETLSLRLQERS